MTGLSAITPLGASMNATWQGILAGKTGIRNIKNKSEVFSKLKCQLGATLPEDFNEDDYKVKVTISISYFITKAYLSEFHLFFYSSAQQEYLG